MMYDTAYSTIKHQAIFLKNGFHLSEHGNAKAGLEFLRQRKDIALHNIYFSFED